MNWLARGWQVFAPDPRLSDWLEHAGPVAREMSRDPGQRRAWLRHGGTWFAGVDILPNDAEGRVAGSGPLRCTALEAAEAVHGVLPLHKAQVSVTYPGYPRRDPGESDAAHGFRLRRDAAHLDGLLPIGAERRRFLREPHAYILGLPVTPCAPDNAPLVVWQGSHEVMREGLRAALRGHAPEDWQDVDLTETYAALRRRCFETCERVEITAAPGQAILLHRLSLHGIAPWRDGTDEERLILYFRPVIDGPSTDWLDRP